MSGLLEFTDYVVGEAAGHATKFSLALSLLSLCLPAS